MAIMDSYKDWSNLPTHQPDVDLWDRIDIELDLESVSGNLGRLPNHSAGANVWNSINKKLIFDHYLRYFYFAGIAVAVIILFFVFMNTSDNDKNSNPSNSIKVKELTENKNNISKQKNKLNVISSDVSNQRNKNSNSEKIINKEIFIKSSKTNSKNLYAIQNEKNPINKIESVKKINKVNNESHSIEQPIHENRQIPKNKAKENILLTKTLLDNNQLVTLLVTNIPTVQVVKDNESVAEKKSIISPALIADTNQDAINNLKNEVNGINPRNVHLKSTNQPVKNGLFSLGIDFTISKIYNPEKFSFADNKTMGQYGITLKYNYSRWFLQTGINYSKFSDYLNYNSDLKLNQFRTFNYVDSVIYNPQGAIIQYITHPVTVNDSVLFQQLINATQKYSLMNIPLMLGYQYGYSRFSFSLKGGILCTILISEKETIILPDKPNVSVLMVYSNISAIKRTNWAGILSAEMDYHFNKRWGISVEPILQYYFKPLYQDKDVNNNLNNSSPFLLGVKTGLFYKF